MFLIDQLGYWFDGADGKLPPAIDVGHLEIEAGKLSVIGGPSGSGKTTFLYLLAGLLQPGAGRIAWDGADISALSENARDRWRREHAGFVFQDFNLIPEMTALQNTTIAAYFSGWSNARVKSRGEDLLHEFGVPVERRALSTYSRGEQQRIALARALIFDPQIVFADEPTASLDVESATALTAHLKALAENGRTVIVVSHDPVMQKAADTLISLSRGRLAAGRELAA